MKIIGLQRIDGITNAFKIPRLKRGWVLKEFERWEMNEIGP
jgi:hypothetical protein